MPIPKDEDRCSATVWSNYHDNRCSRKAVVQRDGKGYCRQHDPDAVTARCAASKERYRAQQEAKAEAREYAALHHPAVEAMCAEYQARIDALTAELAKRGAT